jgi:hypothetical protein
MVLSYNRNASPFTIPQDPIFPNVFVVAIVNLRCLERGTGPLPREGVARGPFAAAETSSARDTPRRRGAGGGARGARLQRGDGSAGSDSGPGVGRGEEVSFCGVWRGAIVKEEEEGEEEGEDNVHIMMLTQGAQVFIQLLDALLVRFHAFFLEALVELSAGIFAC